MVAIAVLLQRLYHLVIAFGLDSDTRYFVHRFIRT